MPLRPQGTFFYAERTGFWLRRVIAKRYDAIFLAGYGPIPSTQKSGITTGEADATVKMDLSLYSSRAPPALHIRLAVKRDGERLRHYHHFRDSVGIYDAIHFRGTQIW
jgi:hypothetical protein